MHEGTIQKNLESRVAFIRSRLESSGMKGIVYGNSGGKGLRARRHTLQGRLRRHRRYNHALRQQPQLQHRPRRRARGGREVRHRVPLRRSDGHARGARLRPRRRRGAHGHGRRQHCAPPAHGRAVRRCPLRGAARRRHRQRQRDVRRLLHQVGRRGARLQPHRRFDGDGDLRVPRISRRTALRDRKRRPPPASSRGRPTRAKWA